MSEVERIETKANNSSKIKKRIDYTGRKRTTYYLSQFFLGSLSLLSKLAVDIEGGLLQFKSYPLHFLCSIAHTSGEVLRMPTK